LYALKSENLVYVTIPPKCTDKLQPMDLSVNKSAKDFLKAQFQNWYAEQVVTYIDNNSDKVEAVEKMIHVLSLKPLSLKMYFSCC
jgi:hypothetical protein